MSTLLTFASLSASAALLLLAHPIHTSVLDLRWERRTGELAGTLRVFEDDLGAASAAAKLDVTAYVMSRVGLSQHAKFVAFESCGAKRASDAILFCVRAKVGDLRGLRVRNAVLMDLHADQVNIVRVQGPATSTFLLTAEAPEQAIGQ